MVERAALILFALALLVLGNTANAAECEEANVIKEGDIASCDGIIMPEQMARDLFEQALKLQTAKDNLAACESDLETCISSIPKDEPSNDWLFVVVVGVCALSLGFGAGIYIGGVLLL